MHYRRTVTQTEDLFVDRLVALHRRHVGQGQIGSARTVGRIPVISGRIPLGGRAMSSHRRHRRDSALCMAAKASPRRSLAAELISKLNSASSG
jgi:hypothetical protein